MAEEYGICMLNVFKKLFFNVYFWDKRETECEQGWHRERGGTESEAGSRVWAVRAEPNVGLKLTGHEIMTRAEVGRLTDWATQAPHVCLTFWEAAKLFSQVAVPFCIASSRAWELWFIHILTNTRYGRLLNFIHSDGCPMIHHCGFNLHCSNDKWCWTSFHVAICYLRIFFVETFCPFLIASFFSYPWVLSVFKHFGYKSFIGCAICKYFLPVCFKEEMFLILTKSDLVIFCVYGACFWCCSQEILA